MLRSPDHRRRPAAAVCLALGTLLATLFTSLLCAPPSSAAQSAAPTAEQTVARYVGAEYASARYVHDTSGTGCQKERKEQPDSQPAAPTRGTSAHELLAPLAGEHAAGQGTVLESVAAAASHYDRAPPPYDPPSPIELSVLRV